MNGTLGITYSACGICRELVPAKVITDRYGVSFRKFCPEHGEETQQVYSDVKAYLKAQRFVKPAWTPNQHHGNIHSACPDGCGLCERHEQHLCMPIIEITHRCNLTCPVCLNSSGGQPEKPDMTLRDFQRILDGLIEAEGQIDVLNISGGEPLLHPDFLGIVDAALCRPEIVRVSVSTNGLQLLGNESLLGSLKKKNVVVSLQFDGFDDTVYHRLRGKFLLKEKLAILERLKKYDIATSLTMTAAGGVNHAQFRPMLDYLFEHEHVLSLMIQPMAFAGRGAALKGSVERLDIPMVIQMLSDSGHPSVAPDDFVPLPCSHGLCFSLAFYLMLDDGNAVSLNRLVDADAILDTTANRVIFGLDPDEHTKLKEWIYAIWSGGAGSAPDNKSAMDTLRNILRDLSNKKHCCFDPRRMFQDMERKVKSIFIHAFQDVDSFDLARARRCCNAYPQADGRLLPACIRNVLAP